MTPIASLIVWGSSFVQPKPQEENRDESTRKDEIPESRKGSNFLLEPSRCRLVEQIGGFKDLEAQQAWWHKKLMSKGIFVRACYLPHHLEMILASDLTQATFDEIRKFVNPTSISLAYNEFIPASDLTTFARRGPNFSMRLMVVASTPTTVGLKLLPRIFP